MFLAYENVWVFDRKYTFFFLPFLQSDKQILNQSETPK